MLTRTRETTDQHLFDFEMFILANPDPVHIDVEALESRHVATIRAMMASGLYTVPHLAHLWGIKLDNVREILAYCGASHD